MLSAESQSLYNTTFLKASTLQNHQPSTSKPTPQPQIELGTLANMRIAFIVGIMVPKNEKNPQVSPRVTVRLQCAPKPSTRNTKL